METACATLMPQFTFVDFTSHERPPTMTRQPIPRGFADLLEPDRQLLAYLFALFGSRTKTMIANAWETNRFESLKLSRPKETQTLRRLGDLYGPRWLRSLSDDDVRELVETAFRPDEHHLGFIDGVDFTYYKRRDGDFCGSFAPFPSVVFRADGLDALFDNARKHLARVCDTVTTSAPLDFSAVPLLCGPMHLVESACAGFVLMANGALIAKGPSREALTLYAARRGWSIV